MNIPHPSSRLLFFISSIVLFFSYANAHNGKIAYAQPLGKIAVDGNLSDWPTTAKKYGISTVLSEGKPLSDADFSAFFQVGYSVANRSLYIAFSVTDDEFIEDTSEKVRFNTQDCLELCIDARHIAFGSGVASFMYSKKLRNTNHSMFDDFAKNAKWDMMEVAVAQQGTTRYYEWRIDLGNEFAVGKSVGLDFNVFDLDTDGTFTGTGWGQGMAKVRLPNHLGDVILLPAKQQLATVKGNVRWDRQMAEPLPSTMKLTSVQNPSLWLVTEMDSSGNYSAQVPAGIYQVAFSNRYFPARNHLYSAILEKPVGVNAQAGKTTLIENVVVSGEPVPHFLPDKGILHDYNSASAKKIDQFIESYQDYFQIPGVSLALIKDGKVIYHKTYGVKNSITNEKVDSNTLFEAASVTKPVFSFAVQRLAERGVINLDKPLYQYLPYPDIEYDERYKLITARHVLTHRTGFPNWRWMNDDQKLDLKFTPGTDYNYSGEGFEYLKMVVEKITGKKVEQVLKEEVLDPASLYHTFFSNNDSLKRMVSKGHYDRLPTYDDPPASPGMAYSMHTEAKAFTNFMLYMLEQKGLSAKTYDTIFSKHSDFKYDADDEKPRYPAYMGMSLEIRETPYGKSFGHGGNNGDFTCHFEVYKDLKAGYVIFTNSNTSYPLLMAMRQFLVEGKEKE